MVHMVKYYLIVSIWIHECLNLFLFFSQLNSAFEQYFINTLHILTSIFYKEGFKSQCFHVVEYNIDFTLIFILKYSHQSVFKRLLSSFILAGNLFWNGSGLVFVSLDSFN